MRIPLLLLATLLAVQDGESDRPWKGLLPDPAQAFTGDPDEPEGPDWLATRVVDGATGLPIPGARLLRYPEWCLEDHVRGTELLSAGTADGDGFARVEAMAYLWARESHWIVEAPGYAPGYRFAAVPPAVFPLERGADLTLRVVDPFGRPVAGAPVEQFFNCGHAPAVRRATTGPDGVFTLKSTRAAAGNLWIVAPGCRSEYHFVSDIGSLGNRLRDLPLRPGQSREGRAVDLLGEPLPGAFVRAVSLHRGPVAATGPDGRFRIEGLEQDGAIMVRHPARRGEGVAVNDAREGLPFTLVLTPLGEGDGPGPESRILVRAPREDGTPAPGLSFHAVGDSGRGPIGAFAADPGEDPFAVEVPAGRWTILPDSAFSPWEFDPVRVEAPRNGEVEAILRPRPRPRLLLPEAPPFAAGIALMVAGEEIERRDADRGPFEPHLPAEAPAVLRVRTPSGQDLLFPVGPAKDGRRSVAVDFPRPHRVALPEWAKEATLWNGARPADFFMKDGALHSWSEGRMRLRVENREGRLLDADVDLPGRSPAPGAFRPADLLVQVREPDGSPAAVTFEEFDEDSRWVTEGSEIAIGPGKGLIVRREGWRGFRVHVGVAGERVLRYGGSALDLTLLDGEGKPADALVLVDDVVYPAPAGRLSLRGFEAGPRRVVACLRDDPGEGRELRLVLAEGETRSRTITLGGE